MRLIVRLNGEYFKNVQWDDGKPTIKTSQYKYDAWHTDRLITARMVARKLGGTVMEFNPLNGDIAIA